MEYMGDRYEGDDEDPRASIGRTRLTERESLAIETLARRGDEDRFNGAVAQGNGVNHQLGRCMDQMERLFKALEVHQDRIGMVLRPTPNEGEKTSDSPDQKHDHCELAEHLEILATRLARARQRLTMMTDQVNI